MAWAWSRLFSRGGPRTAAHTSPLPAPPRPAPHRTAPRLRPSPTQGGDGRNGAPMPSTGSVTAGRTMRRSALLNVSIAEG